MEEKEYTHCLRCKRRLKNLEARRRGYGPHCWSLHQIDYKKNERTLFEIPKLDKN